MFFGNSGSDANDAQVKLVWYYNNVLGRTDKKKIILRNRGYHGVPVMSASLCGLPGMHAGFNLPLPMVRHVRGPHQLWEKNPNQTDAQFAQSLADELEQLILAEGPDTVAAFIAEPIQAAGGVIVPPTSYFPCPAGSTPLRRIVDRRRRWCVDSAGSVSNSVPRCSAWNRT